MTRRREPTVLVAIHRFVVIATIIKLLVIVGFVLVFPALCLINGMDGAAVLLGLLGLFVDIKALDLLLGWARGWAPALQRLVILYHASITLAGLVIFCLPIDPQWTHVAGTEDRGDSIVTWLQGGLVVGSGSNPIVQHYIDGGEDRSLEYRGGPAWAIQSAADGTLWVAPRLDNLLDMHDAGGWHEYPRPAGYVRALAPGRTAVWLVTDSLHVLDRRTSRWAMPEVVQWPSGVALAPDETEILVVGNRWATSPDGVTWTDVTPPDVADVGRHPEAAIGGGGWRYVYTGGMWRGTLHVRGPDDAGFTPRELPASDIRSLVADPHDGRRLWFGTWGDGVHFSPDGGQTWHALGLRRIEIRSIAIDFTSTPPRLAAGGANTIFDRGAYVRPLP